MDFRHFINVLRRFKLIVVLGFVLACVLAFLSFVKVGPKGFEYRQQETWMSTGRVLVKSLTGDPVQLAQNYAAVASSDEVSKSAIRRHRILGTLAGEAGYINKTSLPLPTISVSAVSTTPANSAILANDGIVALRAFVDRQQAEAGVPSARRDQLELLNKARPYAALVAAPRSKTPPMIVFVLVMAATVGLAFVLENLRPRMRAAPPAELERHRASSEARRARRQA